MAKTSELILPKSFNLKKLLKNSEAKAIKFRCEIDIFGKQTLSFINAKDCKKFNDLVKSSKKK